jgi:hypothetical protein
VVYHPAYDRDCPDIGKQYSQITFSFLYFIGDQLIIPHGPMAPKKNQLNVCLIQTFV